MDDPHGDQSLERAGIRLEEAGVAAVLVHGRGATARSILQLGAQFGHDAVAYLAPQAARNEWYPNSFLAPVESNEPGRTSGLGAVAGAVSTAIEGGVPAERVVLAGFSQGACLATEYAARNPTRYGGVVGFSGGLIGESIDPDEYGGSLDGTPVFLGCSDVDPHIPEERVHATADVFERLDADVTTRIYEGMAHTVNDDEIQFVSAMIENLLAE